MLKEVSIEIIRKCPNNCLHCSSLSDYSCNEAFDYDHFSSVVRNAEQMGAKTICLSGGEPFLHNRIIDMIKLVASLGLQSYVYTSGITLDEHMQRSALDRNILKAISKDITKLIFNIEAANSDLYDEIMGTKDCFSKLKQSIHDAHSFSIETEAHFVPMRINLDNVEEVVAFCCDNNISRLSFLRLVLHGRALSNEKLIALSDDELSQLRVNLGRIKEHTEVDIRVGIPLSTDTPFHKCEAANGKLNIRYDGKVFPCEVFKNERISKCLNGTRAESVYDRSLVDIYHDSPYLNIVREQTSRFSINNHCETCVGQHLLYKQENDSNE